MASDRRSTLAMALALGLLAGCGPPDEAPPAYVESCDPADSPRRQCIRAVPPAPSQLGTAPAIVRVDAQCRWNRTGVRLEPGREYDLSAVVVEGWVDHLLPEADLRTGWQRFPWVIVGWLASPFARHRWRPMYALVGAEGQDPESFFVAGHGIRHVARTPGELLFFANDWPDQYGNNHGCLELTIRRVQ